VPLRAINAAWFQWVMHPRYSPRTPTSKRVLDLAIVSALAPVVLPLIGLLALLVKLDGGPVFYRQVRIGESGRTFRMLKLRSMRVDDGAPARWTAADDDRITAVGRVLRRAHLDELPQLINVLKGDMSIVGPRPEQPSFVQSLESSVQFYSRRHVVRPGITGWAQVRVGYAGSDEGTFWKLSHDLYYLKHRSVTFDLLILGETLRMLFTDTHVPLESPLPGFVRSTELETPPAEMSIRD
jgi:lipopolysaccharide/colanic/teichoic acid biosynthesis glycosyltransferase